MRALSLAFCSLVLAATAGCSLIFALSSSPENLPCGADGQCLDGFTCVDQQCRAANTKRVNDLCDDDKECLEGLICEDAYGADCSGANCDIAVRNTPVNEQGSRCRQVCASRDDCAAGQQCFAAPAGSDVTGFCQAGTCLFDGDCGANGQFENICVNASGSNGKDGLCGFGCDPLRCDRVGGCATCPDDFDGDGLPDPQTCEPVLLGDAVTNRTFCLPAVERGVEDGQACNANAPCLPGSFCLFSQQTPICVKWCALQGGNPSCDAPGAQRCNPIQDSSGPGGLSSTIGFCG